MNWRNLRNGPTFLTDLWGASGPISWRTWCWPLGKRMLGESSILGMRLCENPGLPRTRGTKLQTDGGIFWHAPGSLYIQYLVVCSLPLSQTQVEQRQKADEGQLGAKVYVERRQLIALLGTWALQCFVLGRLAEIKDCPTPYTLDFQRQQGLQLGPCGT